MTAHKRRHTTQPFALCKLSYRDIQRYQMETWRAFLRRVQNVIEYLRDGSTVQHKKGGFPCDTK